MQDLEKFPQYFQTYRWDGKHSLFGYPADRFEDFSWIRTLEARFSWLRTNCVSRKTASIYLIREMIEWGGSQNGILQKFDDGIGERNLYLLIAATIGSLHDTEKAITAALQIPGMGLTYASKMLRFLDPGKYGALDGRIRKAIETRCPEVLPKIYDASPKSMINGYIAFIKYVEHIQSRLDKEGIDRPDCHLSRGSGTSGWRAADIEMALFCWASSNEP